MHNDGGHPAFSGAQDQRLVVLLPVVCVEDDHSFLLIHGLAAWAAFGAIRREAKFDIVCAGGDLSADGNVRQHQHRHSSSVPAFPFFSSWGRIADRLLSVRRNH